MRFSFALACALVLLPLAAQADQLVTVPLPTNDLVYDPGTQRLYASVPSSAGDAGNSIAVIDPTTGNVESTTFIGSEPNRLALASDHQSLYVGLDGADAIRRFALSTHSAGPPIPLLSSGGYPINADSLLGVPGAPDSVAVGLGSFFAGTVEILDNGVPRPVVPSQNSLFSTPFAFSASSARLYGYTSGGPIRLNVDSSGVTAGGNVNVGASGYPNPAGLRISNGRLYSADGVVADPEANVRLGTLSGLSSATSIEVDAARRQAYVVATGQPFGWSIYVYDTRTFLPVGTISLPNVFYPDLPGSLVRWGTDGLALRTGSSIYIIRTSLIPPAATADLQVSIAADLQSVAATKPVTYTVTVRNVGASPASNVTATNTAGENAGYGPADTSQGTVVANDRLAVASLGDLAPGASATIHLPVTATLAGRLDDLVVVTSDEADLNPEDNSASVTSTVTAPPIPDLTGSWGDAKIVCPASGNCQLSGTFNVKNLGLARARSTVVRFFVSTSPVLDNFALAVKDVKTGTVPGNASRTVHFRAKAPNMSNGNGQYLIAVLDATALLTEASKKNNVIVAGPF